MAGRLVAPAFLVGMWFLEGGCGTVTSEEPDGGESPGPDSGDGADDIDAGGGSPDGGGIPEADGGDENADAGDVSLFAISLSSDQLTVSPGATADLDVIVTREYVFSEPITVVVRNLPPNVTMVPLTIYAEETVGTVTIRAENEAALGTYDQVEVRGRVGQVDRTVPLLLTVAAP